MITKCKQCKSRVIRKYTIDGLCVHCIHSLVPKPSFLARVIEQFERADINCWELGAARHLAQQIRNSGLWEGCDSKDEPPFVSIDTLPESLPMPELSRLYILETKYKDSDSWARYAHTGDTSWGYFVLNCGDTEVSNSDDAGWPFVWSDDAHILAYYDNAWNAAIALEMLPTAICVVGGDLRLVSEDQRWRAVASIIDGE